MKMVWKGKRKGREREKRESGTEFRDDFGEGNW